MKIKSLKIMLRVSVASLVSLTFLSALALSSPFALAETSIVTVTSIDIPASCSMSGTTVSHSATLVNGTYSGTDYPSGIGLTTLNVFCNDNNGFAIYAIGYTNDEYGNNTLHWSKASSASDTTNAINTGLYQQSNTNSSWSMKLASLGGTYAVTIDDGVAAHNNSTDNFTTWHIVPNGYKRVAYRMTGTDMGQNATGASLTTTYDAYVSTTQPAGSYLGQVKYTLVHPSNHAQPVHELRNNDCPATSICYAPNADDVIGSMVSLGTSTELTNAAPTAGQVTASSNSTATLIAPNFARPGYGFAGWSTEYNYTSTSTSPIYGPNETITVNLSNSGLILYPVWVASTGNLQNWNGCSSLTAATYNTSDHTITADLSSVTALTDTRDGNVYAVARLADGLCWMIENLRLDDSATLTIANTNNPIHDANNDVILNANGTTATHLAASNNSWCTSSSAACIDQTMLNTNNTRLSDSSLTASYNGNNATSKWYGYGNYYNWYSATAGNGTYDKSSDNVDGDLCPAGWHLPYGDSGTGTGGGNTAGGFYYLNTQMSNDTSTQRSKDWRTYPNNFVYSGRWGSVQAYNRSSNGFYWSSSAKSSNTAYSLGLSSSNVNPGTSNFDKSRGYSVRCVKSLPTIDDVEYLQDFNSFSSEDLTSVLNSMTTGQAYHILDNRDNESYAIAKLADGNVWMLDNMKLDISNSSVKANLNSDTTNAPDNVLTSLANNVTDGTTDSFTSPQIITAYKNNTNGTPYGNGSGKVGIYYNLCATSAGTLCSESNTANASYDICPAGWRLPTSGAGGEFHELCLAYDSGCSSGSSSLTASDPTGVQYNLSRAPAGIALGNNIVSATTGNALWSSTFSHTNQGVGPYMYTMNLNNNNAISYSSNVGDGRYGMSIRCIVNK